MYWYVIYMQRKMEDSEMKNRTSIAVSRDTLKQFTRIVERDDLTRKNQDETMKKLLEKYEKLCKQIGGVSK